MSAVRWLAVPTTEPNGSARALGRRSRHAVEVADSILRGRLLGLTLSSINLLVRLLMILVLQLATVVSKTLLGSVRAALTHRLNLAFQRIIDTLSLIYRMV